MNETRRRGSFRDRRLCICKWWLVRDISEQVKVHGQHDPYLLQVCPTIISKIKNDIANFFYCHDTVISVRTTASQAAHRAG